MPVNDLKLSIHTTVPRRLAGGMILFGSLGGTYWGHLIWHFLSVASHQA
jgi:hypothetical protein